MKKSITRLMSTTLLFIIINTSYANTIPIQALFKCETKSGTTLKPLVNGTVNIATTGDFLPTDNQGYFYLDSSYPSKLIQVYLAQGTTILIDCRSRLSPLKAGAIILGERGSSCPCK